MTSVARVQMPDGSVARFEVPEGTSPGEIEAAASEQWEKSKPPAINSLGDLVEAGAGKVASVGTGVLNAVAGMAGLPATLFNLSQLGISKMFGGKAYHLPAEASNIKDAAADAYGRFIPGYAGVYQPRTTLEKYISAVSEGAASMPGAGLAGKILGGISGGTGEAADQATGGAPFARLGGVAAPFALSALPAIRNPQMVKALLQSLKEDQGQLASAGAAQGAATDALGVPTLISHFMDQEGAIPAAVNTVARSMQGAKIRAIRSGEKAAMQQETTSLANNTPQEISNATQNQVSNAGTAAMEAPNKYVSDLVAPQYDAARGDTVDIGDIAKALINAREAKNLTGTPGGGVIDSYVKQLAKLAGRFPPGETPVMNINQVGRTAIARGESNTADAGVKMAHTIAGTTIKDAAQEASPALAQADATFGASKDLTVAPVEAGPLGQSFPPQSAAATAPRSWQQMSKVVGDTLSSPEDVRTLAAHLNGVDPTAFPILLKDVLQEAGGTPLEFVKNVRGLSTDTNAAASAASFKEKIRQNSLSQGADTATADAAAEGANNLLDAVEKVAQGHQNMGGVASDVAEGARSTLTGNFVKFLDPQGFVRTWFGVNKLEKIVQQKTFGDIADLFSGPDSAQRLAALATYDPVKEAGTILTQGLASIGAQNAAPAPSAAPTAAPVWGMSPGAEQGN